jgi:hypothetical protein
VSRGAPGHEARTLPQINPEQIPADINLIVLFGSRAKGTARSPCGCSNWTRLLPPCWGAPAMPLIWWSLIPAPTCCSGSWPRRESCELLVERLLHLSVQAASDLLKHLLMQGFNIKPQTYADTFLQAGRNRLVHDDEAIDPSRV